MTVFLLNFGIASFNQFSILLNGVADSQVMFFCNWLEGLLQPEDFAEFS
jgi:hypothetical protein